MKPGDAILIIDSYALREYGLGELAGQRATVVEVRGTFDHIKGCWVRLSKPFLSELEWYVPYNSIGT